MGKRGVDVLAMNSDVVIIMDRLFPFQPPSDVACRAAPRFLPYRWKDESALE